MAATVRRIESIVPRRAASFGGKAKNLAALARAGFPVPAAYALDTAGGEAFFRAALPPGDRPEALLRAPISSLTEARLEALAERARQAPVPEAVAKALVEAMGVLLEEGAVAVAVRSSSTREDQEATSAAGLHETVLGVSTEEALLDAVRACWVSVLSPRAIHYLRSTVGATDAGGGVGVGVVLQAMVPSEVAGAMFTVNPLSGDPGEMIINAAYGLGSLVMDGRVSPDTFRVDKASRWVRDRVIGDKALAARWDGVRVVEAEVAPEAREVSCLSEELLIQLVKLGVRVEDHFDDPRDVEWAAIGETLYLLQARPVTALAPSRRRRRRAKRRADRRRSERLEGRDQLVWSNVNVGEALPGVATPLTWSVLSDFSDRGFRRAFGALGCTVPEEAELVASFRGRIYLNMTEFMEIASQVPGITPGTILALGGGGDSTQLDAQVESRSSRGFLFRLPLTVARYVRENVGLAERVARFEEGFHDERTRLAQLDLRVLSNSGLDRVLHRAERLLDDSGLVMLNVYGNLLATVVALRAVLSLVARDGAETLERELLTGLADVDSAAPGLALYHIAETAKTEPAALDVLRGAAARELTVGSLPDGPTRRALERFLLAYGNRGAREAEIGEPRWAEDPTLPFATICAHLDPEARVTTPLELERRQRAVRDAASRRLDNGLFGPARTATRHLLGLVQRFMRLRERLRGHVVTVLGLYRSVALAASSRLAVMEPGAGEDGAFYLSVEELHAYLRGDADALAPLIARRRLQLARDRALPDPPDTFVGHPPPLEAFDADTDVLHGLAACGGLVRGKARILKDPADAGALRPGEILVAPFADVGWSPLFLVAGAVVTDLGGPLSHAAVVAREYGVPTVVNVKGATRAFETGDELEVDGATGTVRRLSRVGDAPLA